MKSLFNKVAGLQLYWKETPTQTFFCEYCRAFKNCFLYKTASVAATNKQQVETNKQLAESNEQQPNFQEACQKFCYCSQNSLENEKLLCWTDIWSNHPISCVTTVFSTESGSAWSKVSLMIRGVFHLLGGHVAKTRQKTIFFFKKQSFSTIEKVIHFYWTFYKEIQGIKVWRKL